MRRKKQGLEYVPTTGVRADLKRFMNKFLDCNTVRFEQFVGAWRNDNMGYLCAGRATDREAREFLELVLQIAQEYLLPPYLFQVRVGGLYLLYAIYQIQPISPKVKIRVTSSQWQDSMFFQQQAAQQNHLDVVYVFQRLVQEQAFLFCYTPSEMSLHSAMATDDVVDDLADTLKEEKTVVTSLFNYESLEKLSYLQDQYHHMKIGLAGPEAIAPDKSLAVVQTELVEDVVVLLQSFRETVSLFSRQGQKFKATNRRYEPLKTIGIRRQMLKSQAYNQLKAKTNKRQNQVVVSAASTNPVKAALPDSKEAVHHPNKNDLLLVRKNTNKPGRRTRVIDSTDFVNSDGDIDKDYVPRQNNRSSKSKMRLGDQRQTLPDAQVATDGSTKVNTAKGGSTGLQVSTKSMSVIDSTNTAVDDHYSPRRHPVNTKSSWRKVLAEQNAQAVRKRGRPKKCLSWAKEVHGAQNNKQSHPSQENCSQGGEPPVVRNNNHAVSQCKDGALLKPKTAVKFENTEKKEEQVLQQNAAETKSTPGRRGRSPKSANNMPVIDTADADVDDYNYQSRHLMHAKSSRREVLAEQNAQVVRKRGRPKKYPKLMSAKEVHSVQINKQAHPGQEDCCQGGEPQVVRNNNHAVSHCKDGALLKPKTAVKFDNNGKEGEQVLHQNAAETKSVHRRRGRPPKFGLLTKGQKMSMPGLIACSDDEHNVGGKKAKYELVYLPTGMTSARHASSYSTAWETLRATFNYANVKSDSIKQTVKEISKVARAQGSQARRAATPRAAGVRKAKRGRRCQSMPGTVTEILVGIGKPGVVQYQVVHKDVQVKDKSPSATESSHKDTDTSENGSTKVGSVEERNSSQPIKGLHHNADDSFYRRREKFKRRKVEPDTEPVAQSVERNRTVDREISSLEPASTTPHKLSSVNDSIQRLKKRCKRQLEEEDSESVIQFVKRHLTEEKEINGLEKVSKTQQKTVDREPSVKTTQHKSALLNEPSVTPQKKGELFNEPSAKFRHQTGVFSKPSVKPKQDNKLSVKPEQNTVVLKKLLSTPPVKPQQKDARLSEPSVKSQQIDIGLSEQPAIKSKKTVVLRKLYVEPPKTTRKFNVSAHSEEVTTGESPHKVSETNTKTVSKDVLPPWTFKQQSSSQQSTSNNHNFNPKLRERTTVDPASVQFKFL